MSRVIKLPLGQFSVVPTGRRCRATELPVGSFFMFSDALCQVVADNDICLLELDQQARQVSWPIVANAVVTEVICQEPWINYQPQRQREKEFYDIKLRDGTVIEACWPNGVHWNPMFGVPKKVGTVPIADYRVVQIRKCKHPKVTEEMAG